MWHSRGEKRTDGNKLVAVAIDKDKGSRNALKWAIDHLLSRGQTVILVHVKPKASATSASLLSRMNPIADSNDELGSNKPLDQQAKELFRPFRCFCTQKDIQCKDVMLEDTDVAKALTEYVSMNAIENLVFGATSKHGFLRFKLTDIPGTVSKIAPDFCSVYVISKGKISSIRSATRPAPAVSPLRNQILNQPTIKTEPIGPHPPQSSSARVSVAAERYPHDLTRKFNDELENFRSPLTRGRNGRPYQEFSMPDTDISFVSSGRPSVDHIFSSFYENMEPNRTPPRASTCSDTDISNSFESMPLGQMSVERGSIDILASPPRLSGYSQNSDSMPWLSQNVDDVAAEMRKLKMELKKTMDMYSTAYKEALTAKQKAMELQRWKQEEERRLEEARLSEEKALAIAAREKAKSLAAYEALEASKRIAEMEAQKRIDAEMKALKESEEKRKALDALAISDVRYRRYSIEEIEVATEYFSQNRKIGEGGYGPVYKCYLDHTPVAIKVLRPDAAQGRSQFQQEVEVLCCIRHPNMVLLLGACPEYGCLVYEYMANGSLEDRLFRHGNTPTLSWQHRFRIAAEIGTGLLFLHQAKPEPLVHRDLKPANILLDRNWVSKISDVGLARLVPPSVADTVTQYRMTSTAGTFCYIDPEYQQTGMLGIKSDVYSLGIMLLQILTARPPMGLTHLVERAIEKGSFSEILDPTVPDWPVEEALSLAKIALQCSELRRKDRPDLGKVVLPELNRLRALAEESVMPGGTYSAGYSPNHSQVSIRQEMLSDLSIPRSASGYDSSKNPSVATT
ncbi:Protein kinase domain [Dillenia turbinata]|uniref:RING-type E3 ubiquitin transferase n=1 Tax=Dillenia turbinata TaxID=194707 RepID=A0AAN8UBK3_9MAGN